MGALLSGARGLRRSTPLSGPDLTDAAPGFHAGHWCETPAGIQHTSNNYRLPVITWRQGGVSRTEYAHRFALLVAGQLTAEAIGEHRCNEPLCVRVDPGHLIASTQSANLLYAVACGRTGIIRNTTERHDRHARSLAVREAVSGGWNAKAYAQACGNTAPLAEPPLF